MQVSKRGKASLKVIKLASESNRNKKIEINLRIVFIEHWNWNLFQVDEQTNMMSVLISFSFIEKLEKQ